MDFLDLRMLHLSFNFASIYIIHKFLVLLKNHLNCLKDFHFFFKKIFFFTTFNNGRFMA